MNQPSSFQMQYPLSKTKKFWKKIIGRSAMNIIWYFILSIIISGFSAPFIAYNILSWKPNDTLSSQSEMSFFVIGFLIFLVIFIIATIIYSLYYQVYINRYYYDCGPDFITIKKGIFAPSEIHVQYQKIQDVYVDQDIFDRMFGLYDVHIASATVTSGIEAHIDGVNADVAENLKNILLGKIKGGGNISANSQIPSQPAQNIQAETSAQFQSDKIISSATYPISSSWVYSAMFSSAAFGLVFTLIFGFMSFGFVSRVTGEPLVYLGLWVVGVLLFFVFISLIYFIYLSVWKKNFYFEFMPDYILLRIGVLNKEEKHMPYKSIQNVTNSQGIFDRMFGLSDIVVENAATKTIGSGRYRQTVPDGISLVWQPKDKADELAGVLNDIVGKINPQSSRAMGL